MSKKVIQLTFRRSVYSSDSLGLQAITSEDISHIFQPILTLNTLSLATPCSWPNDNPTPTDNVAREKKSENRPFTSFIGLFNAIMQLFCW